MRPPTLYLTVTACTLYLPLGWAQEYWNIYGTNNPNTPCNYVIGIASGQTGPGSVYIGKCSSTPKATCAEDQMIDTPAGFVCSLCTYSDGSCKTSSGGCISLPPGDYTQVPFPAGKVSSVNVICRRTQ